LLYPLYANKSSRFAANFCRSIISSLDQCSLDALSGLLLAKHETLPEAIAGQLDQETLRIRGARVHNLKNISVEIPHNAITVVSGVSGSGKSSLAFDTVYAEGQRRYVESLSAYARQFLERMEKPDVDEISGHLRPQSRFARKIPRATRAPR